jgi:hypothetical protein
VSTNEHCTLRSKFWNFGCKSSCRIWSKRWLRVPMYEWTERSIVQQHAGPATDMSTNHLSYRTTFNCAHPGTTVAAARYAKLLAAASLESLHQSI